jgi:hypothetical protein
MDGIMTVISPGTPGGYTIFCEDVRKEDNGKSIYIGVYTGAMHLSGEFPAAIPSLKIVTTYMERPGESEDAVIVRVFLPGTRDSGSAVEMEFVPSGKRSEVDVNRPLDRPDDEKGDPVRKFRRVINISPAVFTQPGEVRVRAYRGSDIIKLGALQVQRKPVK